MPSLPLGEPGSWGAGLTRRALAGCRFNNPFRNAWPKLLKNNLGINPFLKNNRVLGDRLYQDACQTLKSWQ